MNRQLQRKWNTYYHGNDDFSYSCDYCGYSAPYQIIGGKIRQKKWRYCPNCGALMVNTEDYIDMEEINETN